MGANVIHNTLTIESLRFYLAYLNNFNYQHCRVYFVIFSLHPVHIEHDYMHLSSSYSYFLQYHTAHSSHSINICWMTPCSRLQMQLSAEERFPNSSESLCFSTKSNGQRGRKIKYGSTFLFCDLEQSSKHSVLSFLFCEIKNKNYIIHNLFSSWLSGSQLQSALHL